VYNRVTQMAVVTEAGGARALLLAEAGNHVIRRLALDGYASTSIGLIIRRAA
jgi:hypothetical protein